MNEAVLIATAALLITSLLVRVVPVFVSMPLGAGGLRIVGQILPTAVFINLAVYVAYSEISAAPAAAATCHYWVSLCSPPAAESVWLAACCSVQRSTTQRQPSSADRVRTNDRYAYGRG